MLSFLTQESPSGPKALPIPVAMLPKPAPLGPLPAESSCVDLMMKFSIRSSTSPGTLLMFSYISLDYSEYMAGSLNINQGFSSSFYQPSPFRGPLRPQVLLRGRLSRQVHSSLSNTREADLTTDSSVKMTTVSSDVRKHHPAPWS